LTDPARDAAELDAALADSMRRYQAGDALAFESVHRRLEPLLRRRLGSLARALAELRRL